MDTTHNMSEGRYKCEVCDYKSHSSHSLKIHSYQHSGSRPFHCTACGKGFLSQCETDDHYNAAHMNQILNCTVCTKTFKTKVGLRSHVKRMHSDQSKIKKLHTCTECDKQFDCKSQLEIHMKTAHLDHTFDCNVCKKSYKSRQGLDYHIYYSHSDKKYSKFKCDQCDFATHRPKILEDHWTISTSNTKEWKLTNA